MNLYLTADAIGTSTGGGAVTYNESTAFKSLGPCEVWGREQLDGQVHGDDPWKWDASAELLLHKKQLNNIRLAHVYAGTFTGTVEALKRRGAKIGYTAAAHNINLSRREHEKLGIPFNYPHLIDPELWKRYVQGYLDADVLICPSQHSADVMRSYGAKNRIEVIPHGVDLLKCTDCGGDGNSGDYNWACKTCNGTGIAPESASLPPNFTVGYLGAIGPDKGLIYLLQAWKQLNYKDATLVIAGQMSRHPFVIDLIRQVWGMTTSSHPLITDGEWTLFPGGNRVQLRGWVEKVSDFYDSISLYVQPSVSEGFGCEVLEAMAHGRAVLCSTGAGAADVLQHRYYAPEACLFPAADANALANKIDWARRSADLVQLGHDNRAVAENYTWDKIKVRYTNLWRSLL